MESKIKVEKMYQEYLKISKQDESKMHPIQKQETKRAFFAGVGNLLMFFKNDITEEQSDEEVLDLFDSLENEVNQFFISETHKQN